MSAKLLQGMTHTLEKAYCGLTPYIDNQVIEQGNVQVIEVVAGGLFPFTDLLLPTLQVFIQLSLVWQCGEGDAKLLLLELLPSELPAALQ